MENILILILGVMLSSVQAGGGRVDADYIRKVLSGELDAKKIIVAVERQRVARGAWSAEEIRITMKDFELGAGTLDAAGFVLRGVGAESADGVWRLTALESAEAGLRFRDEDFWDAIAMEQGEVQIKLLEFDKNGRLYVKGGLSVFGFPVEFDITGPVEFQDETLLALGGEARLRIFGFQISGIVKEYVLRFINPLTDISEWDEVSAVSERYEKAVRRTFSPEITRVGVSNGLLKVKMKYRIKSSGS